MTNFTMRYCLMGVEIWVPLQKTILSKGGRRVSNCDTPKKTIHVNLHRRNYFLLSILQKL